MAINGKAGSRCRHELAYRQYALIQPLNRGCQLLIRAFISLPNILSYAAETVRQDCKILTDGIVQLSCRPTPLHVRGVMQIVSEPSEKFVHSLQFGYVYRNCAH